MNDIFPHLDYKPKLPLRLDHGIGIIGAGGIVNYAHLPAYKKVGFNVVCITDRDLEKAKRTAQEHGIGKVCASVDELLGQQQVVIKSMEANYGPIDGVAGATILGDGSVALILDLPGLIRVAANTAAAA